MLFLIIVGAALSAVLAGLAIQAIASRTARSAEITRTEFWVGAALITVVMAPLAGVGLYHVAKAQRAAYVEMLNGVETSADVQAIRCSRDGPCLHEYSCDPYTVRVARTGTRTVGSGATARTETYTYYENETRYHQCPYVTTEYSYTVGSTLGPFTIATHRFPDHPDDHRWRAWTAVPGHVAVRAGIGAPALWNAAKARLAAARPGPVTTAHTYDNYILASEHTLLTQYSDAIAAFRGKGLLPPLTVPVYDVYQADKAVFVGFRPADARRWQSRLAALNGALGRERHGDLRLVVLHDRTGTVGPDAYFFAVKAHFQDAAVHGRTAFPKNAILLVVGTTDGARVAWARAGTGMPVGNEVLEAAVRQRLAGIALDPDSLLGTVATHLTPAGVRTVHSAGAVESLLFGLGDSTTAFRRVSMAGGQPGDVGTGFLYLKGEIRPSRAGLVGTFVGTFVLSCLVWVGMLLYGPPMPHRFGRRAGGFGAFRAAPLRR